MDINNPDNRIVLILRKRRVLGTADINHWGGDRGTISMDGFDVPLDVEITDEWLLESLNDGGFGCESINGGFMEIYGVYGRVEDRGEHCVLLGKRLVGDVADESLAEWGYDRDDFGTPEN